MSNLVEILKSLNVDEIREAIAAHEGELRALNVLLRAAEAKMDEPRPMKRPKPPQPRDGSVKLRPARIAEFLKRSGPAKPSEIARALGIPPGSIFTAIYAGGFERLEDGSYRNPDAATQPKEVV